MCEPMGHLSLRSPQGSLTHAAGVRSSPLGDRVIPHCTAVPCFVSASPCPQGPEGWNPPLTLGSPHYSPGTMIFLVLSNNGGFSHHRAQYTTFPLESIGSLPFSPGILVELSPLARLANGHRASLRAHCPPWAAVGCCPFPS